MAKFESSSEGAFFGHKIKAYILKLLAGKFYFIWARHKGLSYDQNFQPL